MENKNLESTRRLVAHRDQAIVCAVLSILISATLVLSTFLGHRKDLVSANAQIINLQNLLLENQQALRRTENALLNAQKASGAAAAAAPTTQINAK